MGLMGVGSEYNVWSGKIKSIVSDCTSGRRRVILTTKTTQRRKKIPHKSAHGENRVSFASCDTYFRPAYW